MDFRGLCVRWANKNVPQKKPNSSLYFIEELDF